MITAVYAEEDISSKENSCNTQIDNKLITYNVVKTKSFEMEAGLTKLICLIEHLENNMIRILIQEEFAVNFWQIEISFEQLQKINTKWSVLDNISGAYDFITAAILNNQYQLEKNLQNITFTFSIQLAPSVNIKLMLKIPSHQIDSKSLIPLLMAKIKSLSEKVDQLEKKEIHIFKQKVFSLTSGSLPLVSGDSRWHDSLISQNYINLVANTTYKLELVFNGFEVQNCYQVALRFVIKNNQTGSKILFPNQEQQSLMIPQTQRVNYIDFFEIPLSGIYQVILQLNSNSNNYHHGSYKCEPILKGNDASFKLFVS